MAGGQEAAGEACGRVGPAALLQANARLYHGLVAGVQRHRVAVPPTLDEGEDGHAPTVATSSECRLVEIDFRHATRGI